MSETLWTAMQMSASETNDATRTGFTSENAAWEYVRSRSCPTCRAELESDEEDHPGMTSCGAEWRVDPATPEDAHYPGPTNQPAQSNEVKDDSSES